MVLFEEPIWYGYHLVKVNAQNIESTLAFIENTWNEVFPEYPFDFDFVDSLFAAKYHAEQQFQKVLQIF